MAASKASPQSITYRGLWCLSSGSAATAQSVTGPAPQSEKSRQVPSGRARRTPPEAAREQRQSRARVQVSAVIRSQRGAQAAALSACCPVCSLHPAGKGCCVLVPTCAGSNGQKTLPALESFESQLAATWHVQEHLSQPRRVTPAAQAHGLHPSTDLNQPSKLAKLQSASA